MGILITTIATALAGCAGVFYSPDQRKLTFRTHSLGWFMIVLIVVAACSTIVFDRKKDIQAAAEQHMAELRIEDLQQRIGKLQEKLDQTDRKLVDSFKKSEVDANDLKVDFGRERDDRQKRHDELLAQNRELKSKIDQLQLTERNAISMQAELVTFTHTVFTEYPDCVVLREAFRRINAELASTTGSKSFSDVSSALRRESARLSEPSAKSTQQLQPTPIPERRPSEITPSPSNAQITIVP